MLLKLFNEQHDAIIGEVLSPHGVAGMVKVFPYSDYPERINMLKQVELLLGSERRTMNIEKASVYGRFWLLKFEGVDDREEAVRIRSGLIIIPKEDRLSLSEDSFYHDQLVGLKVYMPGYGLLGMVTDIVSTGKHDLFVVEQQDGKGKSRMVPAIKRFIKEVDLEAGTITVDLPEGLLEL